MTTAPARPLLAALAMLAVLVIPMLRPAPAGACSCVPPPADEVLLDEARVAFVGTQVDRAPHPDGARVVMTISVSDVYKGEIGPVVEVVTPVDSAACGVDLTGAGPVGLYPAQHAIGFEVSLCRGVIDADTMHAVYDDLGVEVQAPVSATTTTGAADDAPGDDVAGEDEPEPAPADTGPSSLIWLVALLAGAAVAVIGFLVGRRRN